MRCREGGALTDDIGYGISRVSCLEDEDGRVFIAVSLFPVPVFFQLCLLNIPDIVLASLGAWQCLCMRGFVKRAHTLNIQYTPTPTVV